MSDPILHMVETHPKDGFSPETCKTLSMDELHAIFSSDIWLSVHLTDDERLNICQEVENRAAASDGIAPRQVVPEPLRDGSFGQQSGNRIILNSEFMNHGKLITTGQDFDGKTVTREVSYSAAGWWTLNTLYHEHEHGLRADRGESARAYFRSDTDHDLYRIQEEEKRANERGDSESLAALERTERVRGKLDPERGDFFVSMEADSFDRALENAKNHYDDANIEDTLNQFIRDCDQGIHPDTPTSSYEAIDKVYMNQQCQRALKILGLPPSRPPDRLSDTQDNHQEQLNPSQTVNPSAELKEGQRKKPGIQM